jgi:hypothetical protein
MGFEDNKLDEIISKRQEHLAAKNQEIFENEVEDLRKSLTVGRSEMLKSGQGVNALQLYENANRMLGDLESLEQLQLLKVDFVKSGLIKPENKITQEKGAKINPATLTRHELSDK